MTPIYAEISVYASTSLTEACIMNRRKFLGVGASALLTAGAGPVVAPPGSSKRVAAVVTTYYRYSHADNIVTKLMEGYAIGGKSFPPPCKVASLFIEQVNDLDVGKPIARRWKVPIYDSIA